MSYAKTDQPLRTDVSFREQSDPCHHRTTTPWIKLPIDLVSDFVIADSLHLLDLVIMKRCLLGWMRGTFNKHTKWSAMEIIQIGNLLTDANKTMPNEIHRAIRALDSIRFWKGTEFRTFLLYLGSVILKRFFPSDVYKHFLQLYCAVRICSSDTYKPLLSIAESLFKDYIEGYIQIYGIGFISRNVHLLCHVVHDVRRYLEISLLLVPIHLKIPFIKLSTYLLRNR